MTATDQLEDDRTVAAQMLLAHRAGQLRQLRLVQAVAPA